MEKWGHFRNSWLSKPKSHDLCFGDYPIIISNFAIEMKVSFVKSFDKLLCSENFQVKIVLVIRFLVQRCFFRYKAAGKNMFEIINESIEKSGIQSYKDIRTTPSSFVLPEIIRKP